MRHLHLWCSLNDTAIYLFIKIGVLVRLSPNYLNGGWRISSDHATVSGKVGLLKIFSSAIFFTSTEEAPSSAPASEASRRINDGSEEKCKLEQQCIREVGGKKDNFFASATENRSSSFWTHGSSSHFDGIRMHTQSLSCTSQSYFCHYSDVKSRVCIRAAVVLSCSCLPLR